MKQLFNEATDVLHQDLRDITREVGELNLRILRLETDYTVAEWAAHWATTSAALAEAEAEMLRISKRHAEAVCIRENFGRTLKRFIEEMKDLTAQFD